jgi:hypothetical protein
MEENEKKTEKDEKFEAKKKEAYGAGLVILVLLAVFTIGEYWIGAVASGWWAILIAIATIKAFLVIRDYMHIGRLFASDEEVHS